MTRSRPGPNPKTPGQPRTKLLAARFTPVEAELFRASAELLATNVADVMLVGVVALGVDVENRCDGPLTPAHHRVLNAVEAYRAERSRGGSDRHAATRTTKRDLLQVVARQTQQASVEQILEGQRRDTAKRGD